MLLYFVLFDIIEYFGKYTVENGFSFSHKPRQLSLINEPPKKLRTSNETFGLFIQKLCI